MTEETKVEVPEQGMKEENTGIVDTEGQEMKKISIPVVKFEEFLFPVTTVTAEHQNYLGPDGQVRPVDIIKELRLTIDEMRNKFTLMSVGLAIAARSDKNVHQYLTDIGLVLSDINQKQFFPFEAEKSAEE